MIPVAMTLIGVLATVYCWHRYLKECRNGAAIERRIAELREEIAATRAQHVATLTAPGVKIGCYEDCPSMVWVECVRHGRLDITSVRVAEAWCRVHDHCKPQGVPA
jgi:hypothetical protein